MRQLGDGLCQLYVCWSHEDCEGIVWFQPPLLPLPPGPAMAAPAAALATTTLRMNFFMISLLLSFGRALLPGLHCGARSGRKCYKDSAIQYARLQKPADHANQHGVRIMRTVLSI